METVKVWVLAGLVSVLAAILCFMIKLVTREVIKRLDDIVSELKQLTKTTTTQEEKIKQLRDQDILINQRLNEHSGRIRIIELKNNHNP
jgi:uncharacterized membrane protein YhiD involved in acid resistance